MPDQDASGFGKSISTVDDDDDEEEYEDVSVFASDWHRYYRAYAQLRYRMMKVI